MEVDLIINITPFWQGFWAGIGTVIALVILIIGGPYYGA